MHSHVSEWICWTEFKDISVHFRTVRSEVRMCNISMFVTGCRRSEQEARFLWYLAAFCWAGIFYAAQSAHLEVKLLQACSSQITVQHKRTFQGKWSKSFVVALKSADISRHARHASLQSEQIRESVISTAVFRWWCQTERMCLLRSL